MNIAFKPIIPIVGLTTNAHSITAGNSGLFENMLADIHKSNKKMTNAITNKVDLHELVTNISLAETNLKILVAVRDSLMNAIHELTKMQM